MATKAKNIEYIAEKPFDLDGAHYEPGTEFTPPAGWQVDEHHTAMVRASTRRQTHGRTAFAHQYDTGAVETDPQTKRTKHVMNTRVTILPVKAKE